MLLIQVRQQGNSIPTSLPPIVRAGWGRVPAAPATTMMVDIQHAHETMNGSAVDGTSGTLSACTRHRDCPLPSPRHLLQKGANLIVSEDFRIEEWVANLQPTSSQVQKNAEPDEHAQSQPSAESQDTVVFTTEWTSFDQGPDEFFDSGSEEFFGAPQAPASAPMMACASSGFEHSAPRSAPILGGTSSNLLSSSHQTSDFMILFDSPSVPAAGDLMDCIPLANAAPANVIINLQSADGPRSTWFSQELFPAASVATPLAPLGPITRSDSVPPLAATQVVAIAPLTHAMDTCGALSLFDSKSAADVAKSPPPSRPPPRPVVRSDSVPPLAASQVIDIAPQTHAMATCGGGGESWTCPFCTLHNKNCLRCAACEAPRSNRIFSPFDSKFASDVAKSPPPASPPPCSGVHARSGAVSSPPCRPPPAPPMPGRSSIDILLAAEPITASRSHPPVSVLNSRPPITPPPPRPRPKSLPPNPQQMNMRDLWLELFEPTPAAIQWAPEEAKNATHAKKIPPPPPPRNTLPPLSQSSAPPATTDPFADCLNTLCNDDRTISTPQRRGEKDEKRIEGFERLSNLEKICEALGADGRVYSSTRFLETMQDDKQKMSQNEKRELCLQTISPATSANGNSSSSPSPSDAAESEPTASVSIRTQGALVEVSAPKGCVPRLWVPGETPRNETTEMRKAPSKEDLAPTIQEMKANVLKQHSQIKHIKQVEHDLAARIMEEQHQKQKTEGIRKAEQEIRQLKLEYDTVCRQVETQKVMKVCARFVC
jgi:hypothetical protein